MLVTLPITGVAAGEQIIAIDVITPDEGTLIGIGSAGHAYSLDRRTGVATALAQTGTPIAPAGNAFGLTDQASSFLELVSDTGTHILIEKWDWQLAPLSSMTPPGHIVGLAQGFALDSATDALYRVSSNVGSGFPWTLTLVGALGVDMSDLAGMTSDTRANVLYGALTVNGSQGLYTIDQTTGHATLIGAIGSSPLRSLALDHQALPKITALDATSGYAYLEANRTIHFTVRRTGDDTVPADYTWKTVPTGFSTLATAGQDYVAVSQPVHFDAGEVEKQLSVQLLDDAIRESDYEGFAVNFSENVPNGIEAQLLVGIIDDDNQAPVVTITSPPGPVTTSSATYTITGTLTDEDPGATVGPLISTPYVPDNPTTASPWSFDVPLHPGLNTISFLAQDVHGKQGGAYVQIWREEVADQTFVFAEGSTGSFFHTDLLFANPNYVEIPVTIDFMREDGVVIPHALTLPPARRVTLDVGSIPGLEATAVAASVHTNNYPIVVERTMTWDKDAYGASTEKGASALSTTWLFAEGSQGFFKTFLLLVNPQTTTNDVTVRFLRESTTPVTKTYTMTPHQRLTIDAGAIPELVNQSFGIDVTFAQPGVAERSMYFGDSPLWSGGHESAGVPAAATSWFLAEGATGPFFETFLLLANPSSDPADVTLTYLPNTGVPVTRTKQVPANGRLTVNIEMEDASLSNSAVATQVSSSKPIVVERSQYWPYTPDQWYEAHNSFGQTAPGLHWGLAEGRVGGPQAYQTYILLANPSTSSSAFVTVRFLRDDGGAAVTKYFTVPPTSRFNVSVDASTVPEITNGTFGADITSSLPIMVERSMYSNAIGQVWAAGTNATATHLP
jgi:hypothetical protein